MGKVSEFAEVERSGGVWAAALGPGLCVPLAPAPVWW